MKKRCDGCSPAWRAWDLGIHKALIVAGSISTAQQRTMKFETDGYNGSRPEMECDIILNVGKKALLSFIYEEERPMLALDMWLGRSDSAKYAQQMTNHQYSINVLALDEATDEEIWRRGTDKLYGIPTYIISKGELVLRDYDPDGSRVLFDIPRA